MSRFTSSPFQKPSPFDAPRPAHPLSPPDTELEYPAQQARAMRDAQRSSPDLQASKGERIESNAATNESPSARFKRVSNMAYTASNLRDVRQPRSTMKWLLVVSPPEFLSRQYGALGHTLSSGPSSRLSQGILMPLFPTMYNQLTAIAREFSFPSVSGLCIYLQHNEGGVSLTPRVSDEAWPLLWSHYVEGSGPIQGLPIAGRIEFDIDIPRARWFDSWVSSSKKEIEIGLPGPSRTPSIIHTRDDSRTTSPQDDMNDKTEVSSIITRRISKHVPRKLSLVDKLDAASIRSTSRPPARATLANLSVQVDDGHQAHALSPVAQEDEPMTAKNQLEQKVNSWRVNSASMPSPLAKTGQTALDPANMPNSVPLLDVESVLGTGEEAVEDLNLDDFVWSPSSAGPESPIAHSVASWDRVPSVHILGRIQGSVCLTPSVCTSFGPPDYDLESVASSVSRLPSPDLGLRACSEVPLTPSTATSWGPPLEWAVSPMSDSYAPSLDLGQRAVFSRPTTPATATSWGPLDSYPPSPAAVSYVYTPDAAHRSFEDAEEMESMAARFKYGIAWHHVWPYNAAEQQPFSGSVTWSQVWPYNASQTVEQGNTWNHVWPYQRTKEPSATINALNTGIYPSFNFYPAVYPHFDIYPAKLERTVRDPWRFVYPYRTSRNPAEIQARLPAVYPAFDLYPAVYPHFNLYPAKQQIDDSRVPISLRLPVKYPSFDIYPAVYPSIEIYPPVTLVLDKNEPLAQLNDASQAVAVRLNMEYPQFDIYPVVYPSFNLYPAKPEVTSNVRLGLETRLKAQYPAFEFYPAVYPFFSIYPAVTANTGFQQQQPQIRLVAAYPSIEIYPATYPHFDIYPAKPAIARRQITAGTSKRKVTSRFAVKTIFVKTISVKLSSQYPAFDIYPAVYPNLEIYPLRVIASDSVPSTSVKLPSLYPALQIYEPAYPHIEPYPPTLQKSKNVEHSLVVKPAVKCYEKLSPVSVKLPVSYPAFNLYPAVYPNLDVYHTVPKSEAKAGLIVSLPPTYPYLNIYPAVYPFFDIYPSSQPVVQSAADKNLSVKLHPSYPNFVIYVSVYPHFDIYPTSARKVSASETTTKATSVRTRSQVQLSSSAPKAIDVLLKSEYPHFDIYPAVYPTLEIYPTVSREIATRSLVSTNRQVSYPNFDIYPASYPAFDIYPSEHAVTVENWREQRSSTVLAAYPNLNIYPAVYPAFDIYSSGHASVLKNWREPRPVPLLASYPDIDIYPAVYPAFDIYRSGHASVLENWREPQPIVPHAVYPNIDIYPAMYPSFDIYRSSHASFLENWREPQSIVPHAVYPNIDIYPAMYPSFDIYRSGHASFLENWREPQPIVPHAVYPNIDIYPAMYPSFDIYRSSHASFLENWREPQPIVPHAVYPNIDIYPAMYPSFDIYRSGHASFMENWREPLPTGVVASYPNLDIYPAVYPSFDIYSSGHASTSEYWREPRTTTLPAQYPNISIYALVYPSFDIYRSEPDTTSSQHARKTHRDLGKLVFEIPIPSKAVRSAVPRSSGRVRLTHRELHALVFGLADSLEQMVPASEAPIRPMRKRLTHKQLHDAIFSKHMQDASPVTPSPSTPTRRDSAFIMDAHSILKRARSAVATRSPAPPVPSKPLMYRSASFGRAVGLPSTPSVHRRIRSEDQTASVRTSMVPTPTPLRQPIEINVQPKLTRFTLEDPPRKKVVDDTPHQAKVQGPPSTRDESSSSRHREHREDRRDLSIKPHGEHSHHERTRHQDHEGVESKDRPESRHVHFPEDILRRKGSPLDRAVTDFIIDAYGHHDPPQTLQSKLEHRQAQTQTQPGGPNVGLRHSKSSMAVTSVPPPPPIPLDRSNSTSRVERGWGVRKRDSLVLEKARAWGVKAPELDQHTSQDVPGLPAPPPTRPPVPQIPAGLSKPVAKLDRSKYPFA